MNKLEILIEEGKKVGTYIVFVPPAHNVVRGFAVYEIKNKDQYYLWLNQSKAFLDKYYSASPLYDDFVELSKKITPDNHIQMVSILETFKDDYRENLSSEDMLRELDRLEALYLKSREIEKNSHEAIEAFNAWYRYAIKIFYNAVGENDSDLEALKKINTGSNGYGLSYAFDEVNANYIILKEKMKNPPKNNSRIRLNIPKEFKGNRGEKANIFISYSHQDKAYLERLQKHLKALKKQNDQIEAWDDTLIKPGDKWKKEIENALEKASVAFLLVSADFLASDFVTDVEIPRLLQKSSDNGTEIIPIILSPCLFKGSNIGEFQAINNPDFPLSEMTDSQKDRVFVDLLEGLKERL